MPAIATSHPWSTSATLKSYIEEYRRAMAVTAQAEQRKLDLSAIAVLIKSLK